MADVLLQNNSQDILLCKGDRFNVATNQLEAHTFAVDRDWYVDNNTGGQVVPLADVPPSLLDFRIKYQLIVRRRK
jgi:hypothetical protein